MIFLSIYFGLYIIEVKKKITQKNCRFHEYSDKIGRKINSCYNVKVIHNYIHILKFVNII